MKYKVKLVIPVICWGIAGLVALEAFFLCAHFFVAIISLILAVICFRLMIGFRTRLNDYFILIRYPFSQWYSVFQKPDCRPETDPNFCRYRMRQLSQTMKEMFSSPLFGISKQYRMTTHQTVINHLKRIEAQGQIKIMTCIPLGSNTLKKELKHIVCCRGCTHKGTCRWFRVGTEPRQFYYVEFLVTVP